MKCLIILVMLAGCTPRIEVPPHPSELGTRMNPVPTLVIGYDLDDDGRVDLRVYYRAWFGERIRRSYHPYRVERLFAGHLVTEVELDYDMDGIIDVRLKRTPEGLVEH